jgi:hypothetical protein
MAKWGTAAVFISFIFVFVKMILMIDDGGSSWRCSLGVEGVGKTHAKKLEEVV